MKILLLSLLATTSLLAADLDPATMTDTEWTEYRLERVATLRANPELASEARQLAADTETQARAVEAAMVKVDPSVAPILAKVAALIHSDWNATPAEGQALTVEEWQKLRAARATALKNNPELAAANAALRERKQALDRKVDDALSKSDTGLAAFVLKLKARDVPNP